MWWLVAGCICVPSVGSNVVRVAEAGCAGLESGVTCSSTISPFSAPTSLHCPALAHPSTPTLVPVSPQPCPAAAAQPGHVSRVTSWSRVPRVPCYMARPAGWAGWHLVEGCCSVRCRELPLLRAAAGPVSAEHGLRSTPRLQRTLSTLSPPHRRGRPGPARPHPCPGPAANTLLATTCSLLPLATCTWPCCSLLC